MRSKIMHGVLRLPSRLIKSLRYIVKKAPHIKLSVAIPLLVIMLAIGIVLGKHQQNVATKEITKKQPASQNISGNLTKETPTFKTLLPEGKTIQDFGGWTRVSPKDRAAAYGYADTLDNTPIIISQQQLPDDFDSDTNEQIDTLAQGYHASHIVYARGVKVYIGTSSKGPQSVILTKSSLLILIKSSAKIADDSWISYINTLK